FPRYPATSLALAIKHFRVRCVKLPKPRVAIALADDRTNPATGNSLLRRHRHPPFEKRGFGGRAHRLEVGVEIVDIGVSQIREAWHSPVLSLADRLTKVSKLGSVIPQLGRTEWRSTPIRSVASIAIVREVYTPAFARGRELRECRDPQEQ